MRYGILLIAVISCLICPNVWGQDKITPEMLSQTYRDFQRMKNETKVMYDLINAMALGILGKEKYEQIIFRLMEEDNEGN